MFAKINEEVEGRDINVKEFYRDIYKKLEIVRKVLEETDIPGNIGSVTQPRNGKVTINSDRTVTYTPNKDFSGTDTFTYTVIDGKGGNQLVQ